MNIYARNIMKEHKKGLMSDIEYKEKCMYMVTKYYINSRSADTIYKRIRLEQNNSNIHGLWVRERLFARERNDKKHKNKVFVRNKSPLNKMTKY